MNKKLLIGSIIAATLASASGALMAAAAANPSGTGQPSVECGDANATLMPHGFTTGGFFHAATVYAGSTGSASFAHATSSHAVAQYDVACFQLTSNH